MRGLKSAMGRPTSLEIRRKTFSADGVNRRMRRSFPVITIGMFMEPSRLIRSSLSRANSALRLCISALIVLSSSLEDCSSSFEVCISSLVLCNSSLADLRFFVRRTKLLDYRLQIFAAAI